MKKFIFLSLFLFVFCTTAANAWFDPFGTKKKTKEKVEFANQIVRELLTPEEMECKKRYEELIQGIGGDHISFIEVFSDSYSNNTQVFDQFLAYYLVYRFKEDAKSHKDLLDSCEWKGRHLVSFAFEERFIDPGEITFAVISEEPRDVIYTAYAEAKDSKDNFSYVMIGRQACVDKWLFSTSYNSISEKMTPEKQKEVIEKLKNIPTFDTWLAEQRKKGL